MKIYTIDYKKHRWNDGTVYRQTIKIDKELQRKYNTRIRYLKDKVNKKIKKEHIYSYEDMKILSYTDTLKKWVNYLHLTWIYEFWKFITRRWLYNNRLFFNKNTIIEVL